VGFQGSVGGSRPLGCRQQSGKETLNKVSNLGRGFIPVKVSKLTVRAISQGDTTFWAKTQPTNPRASKLSLA